MQTFVSNAIGQSGLNFSRPSRVQLCKSMTDGRIVAAKKIGRLRAGVNRGLACFIGRFLR
jgi:hypothetical protein